MTTTTDRKETEIGMIPQEWEVFSVKDCIEKNIIDKPLDGNHGNIHPTSTDYVDTGIPFVMASDLENGKIKFESCHYITKEQADGLQKGFSRNGDVLLSHKATIGRVAMVDGVENYVMLTPQVTYYRVKNSDKLNNKFLYYYFLSNSFQEVINQRAGTGSTRSYIGITEQQKLPILFPPLPEQQAIATILGSIDEKIELLREQNKTLESMGQAMFKSWFVDFDDVTEFEDSELGQIPKGWKVGKLGGLNLIVTDYVANGSFASLKKHVSKIYEEENYALFVRNTDLKNKFSTKRFVDKEAYEFLSKTKLIGGEVIISNVADVGSVYMCPKSEIPMTLGNNVIMIKGANLEYYLYYLFLSDFGQGLLSGITSGSAQLKFNKTDFKNLEIVIPNKDILHEFNIMIDGIYSDIEINLQQLNSLMQIRDNLLPRLMNGKVRII